MVHRIHESKLAAPRCGQFWRFLRQPLASAHGVKHNGTHGGVELPEARRHA